ncbi:MAG: hypothetical protein JRN68_09640 [Nitrososphaerota archaeon]|nr:hypothetical protein [Nitrososphaerota archaeon]
MNNEQRENSITIKRRLRIHYKRGGGEFGGKEMLFDGDERTVYQEHRVSMNKGEHTGTLILTNKRLVLEVLNVKKSKIPIVGKDRKEEVVVFSTPLTEVMKVEVVKKMIGKPIAFKLAHSGSETQFVVADPNVWHSQILKAKSEVGMSPAQGIHVNVSTPSQPAQTATSTHTIERQVVKVRCRYCGGLYDEVLSKCPNCGAKG